MSRRTRHDLYRDVAAEMVRDPGASANEIDRRLRANGNGYARGDVLSAVRSFRALPTTPESVRGRGRPQNASVPFSRPGEGDAPEARS